MSLFSCVKKISEDDQLTTKRRRCDNPIDDCPGLAEDPFHETEQINLDEELTREMQRFEDESALQEELDSCKKEQHINDTFSVISPSCTQNRTVVYCYTLRAVQRDPLKKS